VKNPATKITPLGKNIMKIAVFGAGKSGVAVAKKLGKELVFLTEEKKNVDSKTLNTLKKLKIQFELGGHTKKALEGTDLIVVSPGVPMDIPILELARRKKIPVIGEVELAYSFLKKPIIAVTGTNGKTTTTALIGRLLKDHGHRTAIAGNIGHPLISVNDSKLDYIVAEISSYQLETVKKFKPWISIILNITEDHLTRHKTMEGYARTKSFIFKNQGKNDYLIYNLDDKRVSDISKNAKCRKIAFSKKSYLKEGAFIKDGSMFYDNKKICVVDDIRIKGEHNIENSLAAVSAARLCNVPLKSVRKTLKSFSGVEHRIEFVKRTKGISFYNDSKGTNPDSTIVAIRTLYPAHNIVLILGGRDKMTDLTQMCREIKEHVKDVVLIGEASTRFKKYLEKCGYKRIHEASILADAVKSSYKLADSGDAVLLSPACASFDMFKNFEERGKVFKKIVANL
jgi:UDP-N-acetylmuramoylalanine--D-glutamate ligase